MAKRMRLRETLRIQKAGGCMGSDPPLGRPGSPFRFPFSRDRSSGCMAAVGRMDQLRDRRLDGDGDFG